MKINKIKKLLIGIILTQLILTNVFSQERINLWPAGKLPNSKGSILKDSTAENRLYMIGEPRMYSYLAEAGKNTGAAVLIIPGGGYIRLPDDYSNIPIAQFYQSHGINAFVLCHRLPTSPDLIIPEIAPIQDAQRAMRMIKANAEKWDIDTLRIGVCGTSAGGHVASTLGTHLEDYSSIGDKFDNYSFRPAFMILISPVISFDDKYAHKGSKENLIGKNPKTELVEKFSSERRITKYTPPALLIHANNDASVQPMNSLLFYQSLYEKGISASLHIYPFGGHRLSIENNAGSSKTWPGLSIEWLKEMKIIK